jgi:hypothetical protein
VWGEMSMERLVLQFMGAYTDLQDSMQFYVYAHLPEEKIADFTKKNPDDRILDNFKKLFRNELNVEVPQQISDSYNGARQYRNDLAHLLEIESISGEPPNRAMRIVRYDDYTTAHGWAKQNKRTIDLAEADLRKWTDHLRFSRAHINVMLHIASLNKEFGWPDDHPIEVSWIPWWDGRWGKPPDDPNAKCVAPIGRYRASANPRRYWVPKQEWWQTPE